MSGIDTGYFKEPVNFDIYEEDSAESRMPDASPAIGAYSAGRALAAGDKLADGSLTYKLCGPTDVFIGFAWEDYLGAGVANPKSAFIDPTIADHKLPVEGGRPMLIVKGLLLHFQSAALFSGTNAIVSGSAQGAAVTFENGLPRLAQANEKVFGYIDENNIPSYSGGWGVKIRFNRGLM